MSRRNTILTMSNMQAELSRGAMDYDRYDAFLHHIFKQTQGDAWFRPSEDNLSAGVCLRVDVGKFRVFPYENLELEPFEQAVSALNPVVAVKVRSAAVHAALAEVGPEDMSIYVDANTRIQILDTMLLLPNAEKEQCAAFIRDERVMVIWSDDLDTIIPTCRDFEDRLIKLLWRSRPPPGTPSLVSSNAPSSRSYPTSVAGSVDGHNSSTQGASGALLAGTDRSSASVPGSGSAMGMGMNIGAGAPGSRPSTGRHGTGFSDLEKGRLGLGLGPFADPDSDEELSVEDEKAVPRGRRFFGFGRKKLTEREKKRRAKIMERRMVDERGVRMFAPLYNGLAAALSFYFMAAGVNVLIQEWALDNGFIRFALAAWIPLLFCVSLFFSLQIVQSISYCIGPIAHYHENSKYYSAIKPRPNKEVDNNLPHVTIQMPVYKESLEQVLAPSIESIKKAMQTYARQGGTCNIFINDDGMQLLSPGDRDARMAYYADHGIGWVARPKHDPAPGGYKRAGRFKKASNMNYALRLSLKLEKHLATLVEQEKEKERERQELSGGGVGTPALGSRSNVAASSGGSGTEDDETNMRLEDRALLMAIDEEYASTGNQHKPWAANGKAIRMGEIVLIVDSDTIVPEDCFRDAARELAACPTVAVIQHESDVMQVAHHYFENGIAYFTRRINKCISMVCANGEVAPFVGHNAFLRWRAIQDAAFVDPHDGLEKIWSEHNVSEDFDMALRLMLRGYIIRWATYAKGAFKEGVSLTVDDELNRWQKYAYGCSELMFNPIIQWWRKGPINHQFHRFIWSGAAPLHYKISMLAYMCSYYGIAASVTIGVINYVLLGWELPVDGYYIHSFEIWLATTIVFLGAGNVGFTLLEYRLGERDLISSFFQNIKWIPFFFFFFGGLSIHLSQAILAHLFSYNMTWAATKKEVERSNFFKEVPKIFKRFWLALTIATIIIGGMIVSSTTLVPLAWRIDGTAWAVIFPLAVAAGCHVLFPIVLNPWLMIFSY